MSNLQQIKQAILYIFDNTEHIETLGSVKYNKILWAADVEKYKKTGKTITGATYMKQPQGPVAREMMDAQKELINEHKAKILERTAENGNLHKILICFEKSDESVFEENERTILLKHTINITQNHTAYSISELSHDIRWDSVDIGDELPMYAYLSGNKKDISQDDIDWAEQQLAQSSNE